MNSALRAIAPSLAPFLLAALVAAAPPALAAKGGGDSKLQTTLAPDAATGATKLKIETLAEGLVNPWCVAFLPDGSLLVTERAGRLRVIRDGALLATAVSGVPEVFVANQAGLYDILPHPDFATNRVVFLSYAHGTKSSNALRVARATFNGSALEDLKVIYEAKPLKDTNAHFGGRLAFGADSELYATVGDGFRYREKAQDTKSSFGAVVRLSETGPATDGAFGAGALGELWSKGHRNPQGLAFDAGHGVLWAHEHGAKGGDELNRIEKGGNYGWPLATYGVDYSGARVSPFTEYEGTKQPAKYWTPSIAPSGLAVYYGEAFAAWQGDLLVGALAKTALHRLDMEGERIVGEERYLVGERIRDVRVGPDGAIYVTTEDHDGAPVGKVLRLTPQ